MLFLWAESDRFFKFFTFISGIDKNTDQIFPIQSITFSIGNEFYLGCIIISTTGTINIFQIIPHKADNLLE